MHFFLDDVGNGVIGGVLIATKNRRDQVFAYCD